MSDIYVDAFKDDKRDERLFGEPITAETTKHICTTTVDLPESKSNNVSFMKVELLPRDCRNLLAVSSAFICYSVTQRRNLLRIIDTQTGDKVILRGHESAVLDLSFATHDTGLLCSVAGGEEASSKPHTIVWHRHAQGDWKIFAELPICATLVRAHPVDAHQWLIAAGRRVGVFSSQRSAAHPVSSYASLPLHALLGEDEVCVDAAFSPSGRYIAVAVRSAGDSSQVSSAAVLIFQAESSAAGESMKLLCKQAVPEVLAVRWAGNFVISASGRGAVASSVDYGLTVWHCAVEDGSSSAGLRNVQTVTVQLPRSAQGQDSSCLLNPLLDCALSLETLTQQKQQRYLMLTSRRSNFVACLAVNPGIVAGGGARLVGQPLYHITCLNLRAPVISVGVTTVLGKVHHSAEEGEHLEASCYQESAADAGQASIQQYHVLFAQLFDFAAYCKLPQVRAQTAAPTADTTTASISAQSGANKGMTILNMLNSMSRSNSSGGLSPPPTTAPSASTTAPVAASVLTSPGIVRPPASTASPAPSTGGAAGKSLLDAVLSAKKPTANNPPAAVAPVVSPSTEGLPDFLLQAQTTPRNSSILNILKAASSTKASPVPLPLSSTPIASAPAIPAATVTLKQAPVVPTPVKATASVPAPAASPVVAAKIPAVVPAAVNAPAVVASISKSVVVPAPAPTSAAVSAEQHELILSAVKEMQASLTAANQTQFQQVAASLQQQQQLATKQLLQSVREVQALQSKQGEGVLAAVNKLETEAKRAQEHSSTSAGTMRVEMSEQIMRELVPTVSAKVRDSVRDTVRDAVKAQLASEFRNSFENALLPAFEAGAQAMFQQLQGAFAQGMAGVIQEGVRAQKTSATHTAKLEQEVRELKDTMGRLENTVASLAELVQALAATGNSFSAAGQTDSGSAELEQEDAFSMLKQGRISDAVVRVLEDKDIAVTVALLEQLTPQQVAEHCSHLERLCITQQLAADMSVNIPLEGIGRRVDWIKNLVLSLVSGQKGAGRQEDPNYEQHFATMIGVVLDSISSAKRLIYSAQYDTGEDEGPLSALQIPQSVGTDLHLLEFVIQSHIRK